MDRKKQFSNIIDLGQLWQSETTFLAGSVTAVCPPRFVLVVLYILLFIHILLYNIILYCTTSARAHATVCRDVPKNLRPSGGRPKYIYFPYHSFPKVSFSVVVILCGAAGRFILNRCCLYRLYNITCTAGEIR